MTGAVSGVAELGSVVIFSSARTHSQHRQHAQQSTQTTISTLHSSNTQLKNLDPSPHRHSPHHGPGQRGVGGAGAGLHRPRLTRGQRAGRSPRGRGQAGPRPRLPRLQVNGNIDKR